MSDRSTAQAHGATVDADVIALEVVLGNPVHRRSQISNRRAELGASEVEMLVVTRPAEVEVPRLGVERFPDRGRDGGRVAAEPV